MPNTREKLIELCEDVILSCKSSLCDDCEHNCIDYPNCMGVHFADHLIANGVTISSLETVKKEWISSKDRKPTKEDADKIGRVLVMEYGAISLVKYQGPINFPDKFTHWMPLHEPPKGE